MHTPQLTHRVAVQRIFFVSERVSNTPEHGVSHRCKYRFFALIPAYHTGGYEMSTRTSFAYLVNLSGAQASFLGPYSGAFTKSVDEPILWTFCSHLCATLYAEEKAPVSLTAPASSFCYPLRIPEV